MMFFARCHTPSAVRHKGAGLYPRPCRFAALLAGLALLLSAAGCKKAPPAPAPGAPPTVAQPDPRQEVRTGWLADSEPFSPMLPHLFEQGRIVALPPEQAQLPDRTLLSADYAFSAIDRYGRVYHFDQGLRWGMTTGQALGEPLPANQWDVAWNPEAGALELLITAPWHGVATFQTLRWDGTTWKAPASDARGSTATQQAAPPARLDAQRLFTPDKRRWYVAGGTPAPPHPMAPIAAALPPTEPAGWVLEAGTWKPWTVTMADGAAVPPASLGDAPPALGPALGQTRYLLGPTADGAFAALLASGDLWLNRGGAWQHRGRYPMHELFLARYLPDQNQFLFVWARGRGRDRVQLVSFLPEAGKGDDVPDELNQTALITVNEEDEGLWRGWGRIKSIPAPGENKETFLPDDFSAAGDDAIRLEAEYGEVLFHRNDIDMIELPPRLASLRPEAAAWVPALNGLVVPSVDGLGLEAARQPFFPQPGATTSTTPTADPSQHQIDVIQRAYRIWVFKGDLIDWMKPPSDINPLVGYPESFPGPAGRQRTLSWTFPEPGLFRFEFREQTSENEQWAQSPLLTLRALPQVGWAPDSELTLCPPVVWGDPPQVALVGWCGTRDKARKISDPTGSGETEAHRSVPARGFIARIDALNPREWNVSPLPIPYCEGARLLVNPESSTIYLLGGRIAIPHRTDEGQQFLMQSHYLVWEWNGETWRRIEPGGEEPSMRATSTVAFHPPTHALLSLTPRALFSFSTDAWSILWRRGKQESEEWPDAMGLYVHPQTNLTLGAWYKSAPELHVWSEAGWQPVLSPPAADAPAADAPANGAPVQPSWPTGSRIAQDTSAWPTQPANLIPARRPDTFVVIDGQRLADLRMDVPRDRTQDASITAHLLTLRQVDGLHLTLPTPGLLKKDRKANEKN